MLDVFDAAGRVIAKTNALGAFSSTYDGGSARLLSNSCPNGQTKTYAYGDGANDRRLQQITHAIGSTPISQFSYVNDIPAQRITSWSQKAGSQSPSVFDFGYDLVNQLVSATVTNSGALVNTFGYAYDPSRNRFNEQIGASNYNSTYNALNQLITSTAARVPRTNEWDALNRLVAVNTANQRTEFAYDGLNRMVEIRQLVNGSEVSRRRFVWCGSRVCEERDATGATVVKRFFPQGVKLETGPQAGTYYYTRDHLGSIREVIDASGAVRARYAYDPFGRRSKVSGDVDADFGFGGMFFASEAALALTRFRAYDPELGRWLSRDPLIGAEVSQGPNLYTYVGNRPVNHTDPLGLLTGEQGVDLAAGAVTVVTVASTIIVPALNTVDATCRRQPLVCVQAGLMAAATGGAAFPSLQNSAAAETEVEVACAETTTMAASRTDVMAVPSPLVHMEPFPGWEVDGEMLEGEALEAALQNKGQLPPFEMGPGGRTFQKWGRDAVAISRISDQYEDAFQAANRDMPVDLRLQASHQYAVRMMGGIDTYTWLSGNPAKRWGNQ
jgi:RHS repeat-associated protein